jgi:hypothetical protein
LIAAGGIEELQQIVMPYKQVRMTALNDRAFIEQLLAGHEPATEVRFSSGSDERRTRFEFSFHGDDESLAAFVSTLVAEGLRPIRLDEEGRDLEEVFMRVTKGLAG